MTIKRQLFISYIRMVLVSIGAFGMASRIVMVISPWPGLPGKQAMERFRDSPSYDMFMVRSILFIALFIIIVSLVNSYLTHRMTRRIVKPLEPLSEGVHQIHANNLAFRINYKEDDEFRPVCNAFNEMAAKLETSTAQKQKDEKSRRELIAGISHDLRTPLTSIKGCIEGIETGVASTSEMREKYLAIIKNKAADMERIIEQLFLFSKLDMDEFPLNLRPVNISPALSDMIDDSQAEYASRGLVVQLGAMPEGAVVCADVFMLRNVVINLLENSVKYKTKEQGAMEIQVQALQDSVLLRFTDDGPGVQADALAHLFNIFYRSDPSRSTAGSGLGLAISAKIIERMGGSIHAEQSASGGLAVIISLPLHQGDSQT